MLLSGQQVGNSFFTKREHRKELLVAESALLTRALHFNKGCYLGQEIVERIRSRGAVHRHLRQLELDGPLPAPGSDLDTELSLEGARMGNITSAAEIDAGNGPRRFGIGTVKAEAEVKNLPLQYAAAEGPGTARLLGAAPSF